MRWNVPIPLADSRFLVRPLLQHLTKLERVRGRRAFLIVVKIRIHIAAAFLPGANAFGLFGEHVGPVVSLVPAARTMIPDVDKVSRSLPWRGSIVMIGQA